MNDRLIVDIDGTGDASISGWFDDSLLAASNESFKFSWPLSRGMLEDLRWYLEDYLRTPFGVYEQRGQQVAAQLSHWGTAIFKAAFAADSGRIAYVQSRSRQRPVEVVIRSPSARLLGLPWELMADPAHGLPLALNAAGMSRSLPMIDPAETMRLEGSRLRVLIGHLSGAPDDEYQMVARPLRDRLAAIRSQVDVTILRPPTLAGLRTALISAARAGQPFHLVHFDGYSALSGRSATELGTFQDPEFAFQKQGGKETASASLVAQMLVSAAVPILVLSGYRPADGGEHTQAAAAAQMLQAGVAAVVTMAYAASAEATAEFMAVLYDRLLAGDGVSAAVTAGRQRLFRHSERPSLNGVTALADWLAPVLYIGREISFPAAYAARPAGLPLDAALDRLNTLDPGRADKDDLVPAGIFVNRDNLIVKLEAAIGQQRVALLYGPAGTGKTELAKEFGRWWRDTGGTEHPEWVFWYSFEPGLISFSIDRIVTQIGLAVYGSEFARLGPSERCAALADIMQKRQILLIWDNFEAIRSMPGSIGSASDLENEGVRRIVEFLAPLADHGRSAVIILSRDEEGWLGDICRLPVGVFTRQESIEYAAKLLVSYPSASPRRGERAFGELMEWLGGHPLSMRLSLRRLDSMNPTVVLDALRGTIPLPLPDDTEGGAATSLAASITYSLRHLPQTARQLLPSAALVGGIADADVLTVFAQVPLTPERFKSACQRIWTETLDRAADFGLLTLIEPGRYKVHPAVSPYLLALWRSESPIDFDTELNFAIQGLAGAYGYFSQELDRQIHENNSAAVYRAIAIHRQALETYLGYAINHAMWVEAEAIVQPLFTHLKAHGLPVEWWTNRIKQAVEDSDHMPPKLDDPRGSLWLIAVGSQADDQIGRRQLDDAERTFRLILTVLQEQPPSSNRQRAFGTSYLQLGTIAAERGNIEDAENWVRQALKILDDLKDLQATGACYQALGGLAHDRGQLDEAESWYRKSLEVKNRLGDSLGRAVAYQELGALARDRGRIDEAEYWCRKALTMLEKLGDESRLSGVYHDLGLNAASKGKLDDAENWYKKSLILSERSGDRSRLATTYHELGVIAWKRGHLDNAESWYQKALEVKAAVGDSPGIALTDYYLGTLAADRGELDEATHWYGTAAAIHESLNDQVGMARNYRHLGYVAQRREDFEEARRWYERELGAHRSLGDKEATARTFTRLSLLAGIVGNLAQAVEQAIRSISTFDDFPNSATEPSAEILARITAIRGIGDLESKWQDITGGPIPPRIREYINPKKP